MCVEITVAAPLNAVRDMYIEREHMYVCYLFFHI